MVRMVAGGACAAQLMSWALDSRAATVSDTASLAETPTPLHHAATAGTSYISTRQAPPSLCGPLLAPCEQTNIPSQPHPGLHVVHPIVLLAQPLDRQERILRCLLLLPVGDSQQRLSVVTTSLVLCLLLFGVQLHACPDWFGWGSGYPGLMAACLQRARARGCCERSAALHEALCRCCTRRK